MAIFGASCDPLKDNKKFAEDLDLDYPLLSDPEKTTAEAYGILNPRGHSNRVTFIINDKGEIVHIEKKVKPATHGKDIAKKLAELKFKPVKKKSDKAS